MTEETTKQYLSKSGVLYLWQKIKNTFAAKSDVPSTWAGSSSADGAATSAEKLTTSAGSPSRPVYFSGGVPVQADHSVEKDVPSDANFNDTTYSAFTGATSGAEGAAGLVPKPAAGDNAKYLAGDGTWKTVAQATYDEATQTAAGLMSAADKAKLDGVEAGADKTEVDQTVTTTSQNAVSGGAVAAELELKANLSGAAFTGAVTVPTATAGDSSTKAATTAFVKTAVDAAVGSVYTVKGSVQTSSALPTSGRKTGDVWNVVEAYENWPAGTNWVFDGSSWDALGGSIDLSGYVLASDLGEISNEDIDEILAS